jgi:hypothetical protein
MNNELIEILALLEKHGVQMTGERVNGAVCCVLRKGVSYILFELPREWETYSIIKHYFMPAIEALDRNEALEAQQKDGD